MNNKNELKPLNLNVVAIAIAFALLGLASLYFAVSVSIDLYSSVIKQADVIVFNKAGFYFYGVAIVLLVFPVIIIYTKILKFSISKNKEMYLNYVLLVGVVLMLAVPHVMNFYLDSYAENNNYKVCENKSDRALYTASIKYGKFGYCLGE